MSKRTNQGGSAAAVAEAVESQAEVSVVGCTEDEVRQLAYTYWETRGCPIGSPEEDWLRAEQELNGRTAPAAE